MDEMLRDLLPVDHKATLEFFFKGLGEEIEISEHGVPRVEQKYVASILASHAQTSRYDTGCMPAPADLSDVFDRYVLASAHDPETFEGAGAEVLVMVGFLGDQMSYRSRHNLRWYESLGQSFYDKASRLSENEVARARFRRMAIYFPPWAIHCRNLSRTLRESQNDRFLLGFHRPS